MTDQKMTKVDYLHGFADRVANSTKIAFVALRLRQFGESNDMTQDEIIQMLDTDQAGFVQLALCLEPAEPLKDDFEALKHIAKHTGISLDGLVGLWTDDVRDNDFLVLEVGGFFGTEETS